MGQGCLKSDRKGDQEKRWEKENGGNDIWNKFGSKSILREEPSG
jgi:hypothetical protein